MNLQSCPQCKNDAIINSGILKQSKCLCFKNYNYHFFVQKDVIRQKLRCIVKALQLYIQSVAYRETEGLRGVRHLSIINWIRKSSIEVSLISQLKPVYKVLTGAEVSLCICKSGNLRNTGMMGGNFGNNYTVVRFEGLKLV